MLRLAVMLAGLTFLVTGCLSSRPRQVYALSDAPDRSLEVTGVGTGPELRLRRVLVPDYLDSTDILIRVGAHELRESPSGHWSERLSLGVTRAMWADLTARLPAGAITLAQRPGTATREIVIAVDAFDVWSNGRCQLVANWTILDTDHKAVLASGGGTFTSAGVRGGAGDRAAVAGMANALGELANNIAAAIPAAAGPPTAGNAHGE